MPPRPELTLDAVTAGEGGGEATRGLSHTPPHPEICVRKYGRARVCFTHLERRISTRFFAMERIIRIFASHGAADEADRVALAAMAPQERLDQALALHAHYREALGDAGQGLARVARAVPFEGR